jgi:hypothetical protein
LIKKIGLVWRKYHGPIKGTLYQFSYGQKPHAASQEEYFSRPPSLSQGFDNVSQMWLMGHVERAGYSLTNQWIMSRRLVCSGWNVREVDNAIRLAQPVAASFSDC